MYKVRPVMHIYEWISTHFEATHTGLNTRNLSAAAHMFSNLVSHVMFYLTCGAGAFVPVNGVLSLLTLDARGSYPWPLCWGNALWGYVAFRQHRENIKPERNRPSGFIYACLESFICYTMVANIGTNLLIFARTPSALTSRFIIPVHLMACAFVKLCPGAFEVLSGTVAFAIIDSLGVLDNVTTALNLMEEAYQLTRSPFAALAAAMMFNLVGRITRHYMAHGFVQGGVLFGPTFTREILYSLAINTLYFVFAIAACEGELRCPYADHLYMFLPLLAVAKNLMPLVMSIGPPDKQKTKVK